MVVLVSFVAAVRPLSHGLTRPPPGTEKLTALFPHVAFDDEFTEFYDGENVRRVDNGSAVVQEIDGVLNRLRDLGGLAAGFIDFTCADIYPILKKKVAAVYWVIKGKGKVGEEDGQEEEDDEEEGGQGSWSEGASSGTRGQASETVQTDPATSGGSAASSSGYSESSVDIESGGDPSSPAAKKVKSAD
ncbi:hypothetical protein KSP40_PGU000566 [Platanthera guangdongensis]|uniref:Uncharacterized protein n=1 Tax=Platanthera guangdongensis TaxID=2320717 RepID=A0ABR2M1B6_9ASPA